MQSHASRHIASEFLQDRHPDYSPPCVKEVIPNEIAIAYGRRCVSKLVDVLKLDDLPDNEKAHCLRVLNSLLSNQEKKAESISVGVAKSLIQHMRAKDIEVVTLSCTAVEGICTILMGRMSVVEAGGIQALTETLTVAPVEATGAFKQMSCAHDGRAAILESSSLVIPALVALLNDSDTPMEACCHGVAMLSNLASSDRGIMASLDAKVPACLYNLVQKVQDSQHAKMAMAIRNTCTECYMQLSHHNLGKVAIKETGGIDVLGTILLDSEIAVLKKATSALMSISIDGEAKGKVMDKCGDALLSLMKHTDQDIADNVRATILNCCEKPEVSAFIMSTLSAAELQVFVGPLPKFASDDHMQA